MAIPVSAPDVGELEESYILSALRSGWAAPVGPDLDAFEQEIAERVGVAHGVAVASGTAALHLGLIGLGVAASDVVIVPTLTFVATAAGAVYIGARPFFVDSDPADGNIDVGLVEDVLKQLRKAGQRVAAVVPVDLFGACADYDSLLPLCERYGVPVLEDAAEALGASRGSRAAGSFGRAGVLSFNGNKVITTSGGGVLLSDDAAIIQRARYLATQARVPVPHYEHIEVGYNYRLSNLLAALGRAQLRRLDNMIARRRHWRDRYAKLFADAPGVRLLGDGDEGANCWLTTITVNPAQAGWRARDLAAHLAKLGIETKPLWKPMHLQPVFAGTPAALTGAAERLFETGLALPSGSAMTPAQVGLVCEAIDGFLDVRR
jgi:dTDP-4-amino-4,6-dideoxygalactose transaminase